MAKRGYFLLWLTPPKCLRAHTLSTSQMERTRTGWSKLRVLSCAGKDSSTTMSFQWILCLWTPLNSSPAVSLSLEQVPFHSPKAAQHCTDCMSSGICSVDPLGDAAQGEGLWGFYLGSESACLCRARTSRYFQIILNTMEFTALLRGWCLPVSFHYGHWRDQQISILDLV